MAQQSKRDYLRSIYARYASAHRQEKTAILAEFCRVCGYHRKYAIWLLNRPLPEKARTRVFSPRPPTYSQAAIGTLARIWEATGYLCSQRLKAALPQWVPWARRRFGLSPALVRQLLRISPRQMDRRLQARKRTLKRRLYGTTRPGSLLQHMIPMKTDHWDVTKPGYLEIDLVSHSGASAAGEFLHTLDCVDIQTCWVERKMVMGKGQAAVLQALTAIEGQLPFPLRGIDSDNGSEFINTHLLAFCQRPGARAIQFTRSRAYKKDDNAHIEQKNWTHVRKLLGWERYDTPEALQTINRLYDDLRFFQNLFQPSMKLRAKVRHGSRLRRHYDAPRTPFQRVLECPEAEPRQVKALHRVLQTTDPFALSQRIDQQLEHLAELASRRKGAPRERAPLKASQLVGSPASAGQAPRRLPPRSPSPWRGWTFSKKLTQEQQDMRTQMGKPFG